MAMEMRPRYSQWIAYLDALREEAGDILLEEAATEVATEIRFARERAEMPNLSMLENPQHGVTDALIR